VAWTLLNGWKVFLLRCFGAKVHRRAIVYSGARIYAPWNLEIGAYSAIASGVWLENPDKTVVIGSHVTISQKASLYTASHDVCSADFRRVSRPIVICDHAWICAEAFVGMGVTVGEGAVVGARAAVFKDVDPWTVVGGNPARFIKKRKTDA
jgi:putative colanic acid biosynthesis acetyltransferase WcaF